MNKSRLYAHMRAGATILTPNERLSRFFTQNYHLVQEKTGKKAWPNPIVLSFNRFIEQQWQKISYHHATPSILNESQAWLLWQKIIQTNNAALLHTHSSVALAQQAWRLLQQWQIDIAHPAFNEHANTACFSQWAKQFANH